MEQQVDETYQRWLALQSQVQFYLFQRLVSQKYFAARNHNKKETLC